VHSERAEAVFLHSRTELWQLFWKFGATRPAGWVASKDLQPHRADRRRAISRLHQAWTNGKVRAKHAIKSPCGGGWG
jgi:hypothetical protein